MNVYERTQQRLKTVFDLFDNIYVSFSGGKDSVALTIGLSMLRKYIGFDYEVVAVTLDPQFDHQPMDYTALQALSLIHI